jgi:hypothetical protein
MGGVYVGMNACLDLTELWVCTGRSVGSFVCFVRFTGSILGMEVGGEGFLSGVMC